MLEAIKNGNRIMVMHGVGVREQNTFGSNDAIATGVLSGRVFVPNLAPIRIVLHSKDLNGATVQDNVEVTFIGKWSPDLLKFDYYVNDVKLTYKKYTEATGEYEGILAVNFSANIPYVAGPLKLVVVRKSR